MLFQNTPTLVWNKKEAFPDKVKGFSLNILLLWLIKARTDNIGFLALTDLSHLKKK